MENHIQVDITKADSFLISINFGNGVYDTYEVIFNEIEVKKRDFKAEKIKVTFDVIGTKTEPT